MKRSLVTVTVRMSLPELHFSRRHVNSLGICRVSCIEIWSASISSKSLRKRHRRRNWNGPFTFCQGIGGFNFILKFEFMVVCTLPQLLYSKFHWYDPQTACALNKNMTCQFSRSKQSLGKERGRFNIRKQSPSARLRSYDTEEFDSRICSNFILGHVFRTIGGDCMKWHWFVPEYISIQWVAVSDAHESKPNNEKWT